MSVRCCRLIDRLLETELLDDLCRTEVEELLDLQCDLCISEAVGFSSVSVYEDAERTCYSDGV